jgi:hypothetical protein
MTLIQSPTGQFMAYWYPTLNLKLIVFCGYTSTFPVQLSGEYLILNGYLFTYHDLLHYEISLLDRIEIGTDYVSGIHGICLPIFPGGPTVSEYDGLLDEARVAMHEWLTQRTIYNSFKLCNWFVWLIRQRINPFAVLYRQYLSIQCYSGNVKEAAIGLIQEADRFYCAN